MHAHCINCQLCALKIHQLIKTHDSELRDQLEEEAGCMQRTSELFTCSTAVKFVDALNKPPLKLLLKNSAPSNHIESADEIGTTNNKYQPLQILWHPFVYPCSKNHPLGTYSLIY